MNNILRITRKELSGFFASPAALIFLGTFLAVTLFIFFWVETFFARNIADVRPLFEWMPVLLIFLTSAITMRLWSEERRAGTLEFLLTTSIKPVCLVLGKFFACLSLVSIALVLTLPLPITVSFIGLLDWGPVIGGYIAALFLAASYIGIGLYASIRSENQIVSLITAVLVCSLFYLLGSDMLTGLFGNKPSEFLQLIGSGSRFESITRGVVDLRDLVYYLSLVGIFLSLNVYGLERIRWSGNKANRKHRQWGLLTILLVINFIVLNLWLSPVNKARLDLTQGNIYSISDATRSYLSRLKEPLLIRGYFSAQTHPLLAPLVPRLKDLMKEYQIAGQGKVRVEFVDPHTDQELEQEAGQKYGIKPVPFETTSKYQASVTNSYFDILIKYGDQFETLSFKDLIEIKAKRNIDIDVELRNPEYDITRAIKKVLYSYQGRGNLFSNISKPIVFKEYISADNTLPEVLIKLKSSLAEIMQELSEQGSGKISVEMLDPDADEGRIAKQIQDEYGFQPMAASLFDTKTFWFYMVMDDGKRQVQVPLPESFSKEELKRSINGALKRFSSGFLKTVALSMPEYSPAMPQYGIAGSGKSYKWLRGTLEEEYNVIDADLSQGQVPADADLLLVLSPDKLDEKQLFGVDQFLMQGGTIILSTSPIDITFQGNFSARKLDSGLSDWLARKGLLIEEDLVLDKQNSAFPVPVQRQIGGFTVEETMMVNYPFFVDIRQSGMDKESGLSAGVEQVSMSWPSPITLDNEKNKDRKIVRLLESSDQSWTSDSLLLQPDFQRYPQIGFPEKDEKSKQLLSVILEGRFESWFKGKPSPLLSKKEDKEEVKKETKKQEVGQEKKKDDKEEKPPVVARVIEKSPESARIVLFSSNVFLTDTALQLASGARRTRYEGPVQLVKNCIDWSLEDRGLLSIRGRSQFSRTLIPLGDHVRMFLEYLNYSLTLFGLVFVWFIWRMTRKRALMRRQALLDEGRA